MSLLVVALRSYLQFILDVAEAAIGTRKIFLIRIGRLELSGDPDYLWYIVAHELAHAQAEKRESHSIAFWLRLGKALDHAGKVELLRYGYAYREIAMRVAEEYGLADVPKRRKFKLAVGTTIDDSTWKKGKIHGRFRRTGQSFYRPRTRGWCWPSSESVLLREDGID